LLRPFLRKSIARFPTVQQFASYCRLVKCKSESAGKSYGTSGAKIGNAHLKWAFSEAAVLFLRCNPDGQKYLEKLSNRHGKGKALSILAHKLGRIVYFVLKRKKAFNMQQFLNQGGDGVVLKPNWNPCGKSMSMSIEKGFYIGLDPFLTICDVRVARPFD
jgi:transposase IS116/IS110/IS902 family protein